MKAQRNPSGRQMIFYGILIASMLLVISAGKKISRAQTHIPDQTSSKSSACVSQIFDRSVEGSGLFSKSFSAQKLTVPLAGNLWIQSPNGIERYVASNVVRALFSPDGQKIVFATSASEIVLETVEGKFLARIPRAYDPMWCSDGSAVTFLAISSAEYPDFQQRVIYDLNAKQVSGLSKGD
jgi:hypothetical protein